MYVHVLTLLIKCKLDICIKLLEHYCETLKSENTLSLHSLG